MVKKNQIIPINDNINIHNEPRNNNVNKINTIDYYLKKDIPFKKSKEKISNENFIIPKIHEYYNIININYNLQQLKQINKFYDFKFSGNKDDLKKQIYNYMYYSYQATIIQKVFKRLL